MISIIIPVYNTSKYLNKCVDSILNSSYKEIEIVLVNDGSTDNSLDICNEYVQNYDNIQVLSKENGGIASARNAGLAIAQGEKIMFVDGDDWIDGNYIKVLNDVMEEYGVDIVSGEYISVDGDVKLKQKKLKINLLKDNHAVVKNSLKHNYLYCVVRNLYSKKLLGDLIFDDSIRCSEDQIFNYEVFAKVNSMAVTNYVGYFYYNNAVSVSSGILKANQYEDIATRLKILANVKENYPELEKFAYRHLLKGYYGFYMRALINGHDDNVREEDIGEYKNIVINNKFELMKYKDISLVKKLSLFIIKYDKLAKWLAKMF